MQPDVAYEAFLFSSRHTLDAVQLVSRAWRVIVGESKILHLRYIVCVGLNECSNRCFINAEGETNHFPTFDTEEEKQAFLRRLNNAFIEELVVCFACGTFLQHLREHSDDFFCRINKLSTDSVNGHVGNIQHDLVAFVARTFEPKTYEPQLEQDHGLREQYVLLFDHESLRHSIERLELLCDDFMEVPTSVLPALFDVSTLQECNVQCASDPTAWINGFIQTFEQAEGELHMVRSVMVVLNGGYGESRPNNVARTPSRLVHPTPADLPLPRTAIIDTLLVDEEESQTTCELYVFANDALAKRLQVYKWRIDEEETGRTCHHEVTHIVLIDV